jgi:hypothetical protein
MLGAVAALREALVTPNVATLAGRRSVCGMDTGVCALSSMKTYQVSHPLRDLVWLRRGGPPPGPAIVEEEVIVRGSERREKRSDEDWLVLTTGDDSERVVM